MARNQNSRVELVLVAAILLLLLLIVDNEIGGGTEERVFSIGADYSIGAEDYTKAIPLHREVVRRFPENALAHYYLGFAPGMMGDRKAELREYRRVAALGLRNWDLFLKLGLDQLENGDLDAATDSLRKAVPLGDKHSESHLNLAVVDERRAMLADAERETLASLRLNRKQPDARNLLGVIYAQEGKTSRASLVWRELVRDFPDYRPARINLALLDSQSEIVLGEAAVAPPTTMADVKAIKSARKPTREGIKIQRSPRSARQGGGE